MSEQHSFALPGDFDWAHWLDRWDRMQERYLVRRSERFQVMGDLIAAARPDVRRVLDLGCGTGSTMYATLQRFSDATVIGVDLDPTLLPLAARRLSEFGERAVLHQCDIRRPEWTELIHESIDAVTSATALHWLNADALSRLYGQLHGLLTPGGIFLNADHVPNPSPAIQFYWEHHCERMRAEEGHGNADDWDTFWRSYSEATRQDLQVIREPEVGEWNGEELPLAWHLDRLRENGFTAVDCFWRSDCDAIYGGLSAVE